MYCELSDFAARLRAACSAENAQFYILYHINPDGDCIGSSFALALILRALGARVCVCGRDAVPAQFRSLTNPIPNDTLDDSAQYIAVDCSDRSRTGKPFCEQHFAFWIDHHGVPDEQADFEYVHPENSACSELVLEIAEVLGIPVTRQMADLLYTALVTDTSCFRTPSTNAQSFSAAERLTRYGAVPYEIGRQHAMIKTPERLKLEAHIFSGMRLLCGGRLVSAVITLADLADCGIAHQNAPEMQNINGLLEVIGSAEITVMVREYPQDNAEGCTRYSVKSMVPLYSAKEIAQHFGGGGHKPAAGGFRSESTENVREMLEAYCAELLG